MLGNRRKADGTARKETPGAGEEGALLTHDPVGRLRRLFQKPSGDLVDEFRAKRKSFDVASFIKAQEGFQRFRRILHEIPWKPPGNFRIGNRNRPDKLLQFRDGAAGEAAEFRRPAESNFRSLAVPCTNIEDCRQNELNFGVKPRLLG